MTESCPPNEHSSKSPSDRRHLGGDANARHHESPAGEQGIAIAAHLLGFLTSFLGPTLLCLASNRRSRFAKDQSREAIGFQVNMIIIYVIVLALAPLHLWEWSLGLAALINLTFSLAGALVASRGTWYRYPTVFRMFNGGVLVGTANLVPGVSGGTMLVAVGIYPQVIASIAEVSTFHLKKPSLLLLAYVVGGAALAIAAFAGEIKDLVLHDRWIMYSLFIGLTLGGAPVIWRMLRPVKLTAVLASVVGLLTMVVLALTQSSGVGTESTADTQRLAMLVLAGVAAGGAMILPGVSGAYLFLILGQYVLILTAIQTARQAVTDQSSAQLGDAMWVLVPVGVGVVIGVVGVSNLIKFLLDRFPKATLGFLLGLLLGAVVGLWPFQRPVPPPIGDTLQDQLVTEQHEFFSPNYQQVLGSLGLIIAGLAISTAVAHIGRNDHKNGSD